MPHRLLNNPIFAALVAAIGRPMEFSVLAWAGGALAGAASTLWDDTFTLGFLLVAVASLLDLQFGALVALREGRYDPERKRRGRDQKVIGLTMLLMLRMVEFWAVSRGLLPIDRVMSALGLSGLAATHLAQRGGVVSGVIVFGVMLDELQSWEAHRVKLGGRRWFLWSALMSAGRTAQARLAAGFSAAVAGGASGKGP